MYYSFKEKGRNFGKSGSFAVVSVKKLRNKGRIKVKKKEICIAMILKKHVKIRFGNLEWD